MHLEDGMNRLLACALALFTAACASAPAPVVVPAQLPASSAAGLPPLIPLTHFFDNPEISGAQISPDGQWLSFLKPYQGRMNIHVRPVGGGADRLMTTDTVRPISGYRWSIDSSQLLYVQDRGGDENFHIYAVPLAGTGTPEARNLTPFPGVRAFIYAVPRELPDRILVGLNRRDAAVHDAYWLDLATGELTLVVENPGRLAAYYLDPQQRVTAAMGQGPAGETVIFHRTDEGGPWREVASYPAEEMVSVLRFHRDGRRLYLTTNHGTTDLARLAYLDLATGAETPIETDPLGQVDIGEALFSERTGELLATVYVADTVRMYPKTPEMERDLARLRQVHTGSPGIRARTLDERRWIVSFSSPTDPGATYLFDRDTGEGTFLFRPRPWLEREHLAEMRPISYRARDGLTVHGYLTTPRGVEPRDLPLVLVVHGGPWARDVWGYHPEVQLLANRGYAVLQLNYRGSTGYGKAFFNAAVGEFAGAMHTDLIDGVEWAVAQRIADRDRVGIYGGSYGGYATLVGLTFTPDVFACGVSYVGPSSLITLIESFPAYWRPFLEGTWFRFVGDPADPEVRAELERRSPITFVDRIVAPLLIVQGENDPRVTKLESDQLAIALRDRGVEVRYINAENEGHGFINANNSLALYRSMELFFSDCLGGRVQPSVDPAIEQRIAQMTVNVDTLRLPARPAAAAAAAVSFAGATLQPGTFRYRQVVEAQGRTIEGESTVSLSATPHAGEQAWLLVETAQAGGVTGTDSVVLERGTLRPLRRVVHQGPAVITLDFAEGSVTGQLQAGPQQMPINATVPGRVFVDGTPLSQALRTLSLEPGHVASLHAFDLMGARAVQQHIEVGETESVTVPAGTFDAVRVQVRPADGSPGGATVWIERAAPHRVLRTRTELPAAAGGGTVTRELVGS
jgi:dipeptidyl aminopeptidase/acylaminoacyl peptidase